jgi:hypothetical protein
MKQATMKLAILGAFGCLSFSAAADWENLPAAGVPVGGGTSPYILCNPTGAFGTGSGANSPVKPTSNTDECARMVSSETTAPDPNFTGFSANPAFSATRNVTLNSINIGEVKEYIWRRTVSAGVYQCIYGMKVNMFLVDYNTTAAGNQYFEVNDLARKGWSGKTIDVAYSTYPTVAEPTYRIGRTFTSVQYRDEPGYVAQPLTGYSGAINGVNQWPTPAGEPTAAQQQADVNADWVDFTTDVNRVDDDGSSSSSSGMYYVRTSCSSGSFTTAADAIRVRMTFQELSGDGVTDNPFTEVQVTGYLPN